MRPNWINLSLYKIFLHICTYLHNYLTKMDVSKMIILPQKKNQPFVMATKHSEQSRPLDSSRAMSSSMMTEIGIFTTCKAHNKINAPNCKLNLHLFFVPIRYIESYKVLCHMMIWQKKINFTLWLNNGNRDIEHRLSLKFRFSKKAMKSPHCIGLNWEISANVCGLFRKPITVLRMFKNLLLKVVIFSQFSN